MQLVSIIDRTNNRQFNILARVFGDPIRDLDNLRAIGISLEYFDAYDGSGQWLTSSEL